MDIYQLLFEMSDFLHEFSLEPFIFQAVPVRVRIMKAFSGREDRNVLPNISQLKIFFLLTETEKDGSK